MPAGRPSDYSDELAATICEQVSAGKALRDVCREKDMPSPSSVYLWLSKYAEFSDLYARAKENRAHVLLEEIIDISDEEGDPVRNRLRVDARKWAAGKMNARHYGDKLAVGGDRAMDPIQTESITASDLAMALLGKLRPAIEGD
jgi:transposase-like protein